MLSKILVYLESVVLEKVVYLPIACQSECSLADRISDSFAIHRLSSHMLLAAEERFEVA